MMQVEMKSKFSVKKYMSPCPVIQTNSVLTKCQQPTETVLALDPVDMHALLLGVEEVATDRHLIALVQLRRCGVHGHLHFRPYRCGIKIETCNKGFTKETIFFPGNTDWLIYCHLHFGPYRCGIKIDWQKMQCGIFKRNDYFPREHRLVNLLSSPLWSIPL